MLLHILLVGSMVGVVHKFPSIIFQVFYVSANFDSWCCCGTARLRVKNETLIGGKEGKMVIYGNYRRRCGVELS